jgi:hypothetical protein
VNIEGSREGGTYMDDRGGGEEQVVGCDACGRELTAGPYVHQHTTFPMDAMMTTGTMSMPRCKHLLDYTDPPDSSCCL